MQIAYLCADVGIPVYGCKGSSIHIRSMVTAWQRMGHQVTIFSPSTTEGLAHYQGIEQLQTVPTPLPALFPEMAHELDAVDQLLGRPSRVKQDLRNFWYNRTFYDAVAPHLQTGRYDFVYERYTLFHYAGIALAKAHRLPHVLEVNAPLCYEKEKMAGLEMKGLAETLEQRIFTESDRVAVVSETLRDFVATRGVPAAQILLTPNGIDPESFHAAPETAAQVRRRYQIPTDQCVIGFVGSLKSWHGTNTLIDALAHLRRYPVHLLLVGDGPEKARLMAQVAALDLNALVTFTGDVTHDQIPAHIAAMDITCAPYGEQENFYFSPIKIFEYMAVGKAVVAGSIGQVANLVQHEENGLLYPPGDVPALAQALAQLILHPEVAAQFGAAGRAWVRQNRTWQRNADAVLQAVAAIQAQTQIEVMPFVPAPLERYA
jgi:glycosyltransferase involved in cell wall biosynthesis